MAPRAPRDLPHGQRQPVPHRAVLPAGQGRAGAACTQNAPDGAPSASQPRQDGAAQLLGLGFSLHGSRRGEPSAGRDGERVRGAANTRISRPPSARGEKNPRNKELVIRR